MQFYVRQDRKDNCVKEKKHEHEPATCQGERDYRRPRFPAQPADRHIAGYAISLQLPQAKVYSVATFYENFSLEPKGKHIIRVCDGTACHVRKSQPIYDAIHDYMHLTGKRKTDADGLFTLETVACLGACGLSPVLTIDGEVHAKMTPDSALALLESIRKEEELAK